MSWFGPQYQHQCRSWTSRLASGIVSIVVVSILLKLVVHQLRPLVPWIVVTVCCCLAIRWWLLRYQSWR